MLHGHHYQNAYITRDIEKALARFAKRTGRDDLRSFEIEVEATTPQGTGKARMKLALFWVDDLQYELIEPISGMVDIYADELPADDAVRFHHVAARVDDWDSFRAEVDRLGLPIVREGESGDMLKYVYLDMRDLMGHYVEYVWAAPDRWAGMGAPWAAEAP
jgi:catechol 2,3-dioxygenase-like lactoylglutathione lyase family enzyme